MTTEVFTDRAAFLAALHGTKRKRTKRGRNTRPDLPAAGRATPTGLTGLIAPKAGSGEPAWSVAFDVQRGYRLFVINDAARDTGWCADERAACDAAKGLS